MELAGRLPEDELQLEAHVQSQDEGEPLLQKQKPQGVIDQVGQ